VAILYPVFLAVYLYFADDDTGAAAWGGPLGDAIGGLLLHALLFAPLFFAPFFLQRSWQARVGAACLLLPAIAEQAFYVVFGTLGLRLNDGIEAWTLYLVSLTCLIVLGAAMTALLSPNQPLTPASSVEPPAPPTLIANDM
jgi:hypothetical protein